MTEDEKLPLILTSQGGFAYNRQHIDYWQARALKAERKFQRLSTEVQELRAALTDVEIARTRLQTFADEANAGHVQAGGRELARKIWGAFAEYDSRRAALKPETVK